MDLVVLVGRGDNVDNPFQGAPHPYMQGIQSRSSAYIRAGALKLSEHLCGEKSDKMGAAFCLFDPFHIWRQLKRMTQIWWLYFDGFLSFLEQVSDFSTVESTYPQFSATYPQVAHRTPLWPDFPCPQMWCLKGDSHFAK
jgi:hypothetical protein